MTFKDFALSFEELLFRHEANGNCKIKACISHAIYGFFFPLYFSVGHTMLDFCGKTHFIMISLLILINASCLG